MNAPMREQPITAALYTMTWPPVGVDHAARGRRRAGGVVVNNKRHA